jgi:acetoin utilization deacetylase AcuC-like enzyme
VGIKGPGAHPTLWRRAWRDKILPAVVNFNPDLIMVSAGFDAHRKDVINYRCAATRGLLACSGDCLRLYLGGCAPAGLQAVSMTSV